jgi:hypothetical protein
MTAHDDCGIRDAPEPPRGVGLESMYTLIATTLYIARSEGKDIRWGTVTIIDWCEDTL